MHPLTSYNRKSSGEKLSFLCTASFMLSNATALRVGGDWVLSEKGIASERLGKVWEVWSLLTNMCQEAGRTYKEDIDRQKQNHKRAGRLLGK